jgi:hypothetical protein
VLKARSGWVTITPCQPPRLSAGRRLGGSRSGVWSLCRWSHTRGAAAGRRLRPSWSLCCNGDHRPAGVPGDVGALRRWVCGGPAHVDVWQTIGRRVAVRPPAPPPCACPPQAVPVVGQRQRRRPAHAVCNDHQARPAPQPCPQCSWSLGRACGRDMGVRRPERVCEAVSWPTRALNRRRHLAAVAIVDGVIADPPAARGRQRRGRRHPSRHVGGRHRSPGLAWCQPA